MTEFNFQLAEWLPDLPDLDNKGLVDARNCIPAAGGYIPIRDLEAANVSALPSTCIGAVSTWDKSSSSYVYVGTDSALYQVTETTLTDRSQSGGYSVSAAERWEFAQFGQTLIAANIGTTPQKLTLGGAAFADLGGSPPKARHCVGFGDFLVLGNVDDTGDGLVPNRVHWSAFNDIEGWTAGTGQSDYQDLDAGHGAITKLVDGEVLLVFQERGIVRGTYEGPPTIMRFQEIEHGRGAPFQGGVVSNGTLTFYIAQDGIFATDGTRSFNIGQGKVNRWFWETINPSGTRYVTSAIDPIHQLVMWTFPRGSSLLADTVLMYDWGNNKFAYAEMDIQCIFTGLTTGYTMDGMGSYEALLDDNTIPLDDRFWSGGDLTLLAFNRSHVFSTFTGSKKNAVFVTPEANLNPGGTALVNAVRPFTDGVSSIRVGSRYGQNTAVTFSSAQSLNSIGEADFRQDGRYHRVELTVSSEWSYAQGGRVDFENSGGR